MTILPALQALCDACAAADPAFAMISIELPPGAFEALAAEAGGTARWSTHATMLDVELTSGVVRAIRSTPEQLRRDVGTW